MIAETRVKLTRIIAKLPEEAVDSLYETACRLCESHADDEKPDCPYVIAKQSSAMAINAVNRNTDAKTVEKLLSPRQIP